MSIGIEQIIIDLYKNGWTEIYASLWQDLDTACIELGMYITKGMQFRDKLTVHYYNNNGFTLPYNFGK